MYDIGFDVERAVYGMGKLASTSTAPAAALHAGECPAEREAASTVTAAAAVGASSAVAVIESIASASANFCLPGVPRQQPDADAGCSTPAAARKRQSKKNKKQKSGDDASHDVQNGENDKTTAKKKRPKQPPSPAACGDEAGTCRADDERGKKSNDGGDHDDDDDGEDVLGALDALHEEAMAAERRRRGRKRRRDGHELEGRGSSNSRGASDDDTGEESGSSDGSSEEEEELTHDEAMRKMKAFRELYRKKVNEFDKMENANAQLLEQNRVAMREASEAKQLYANVHRHLLSMVKSLRDVEDARRTSVSQFRDANTVYRNYQGMLQPQGSAASGAHSQNSSSNGSLAHGRQQPHQQQPHQQQHADSHRAVSHASHPQRWVEDGKAALEAQSKRGGVGCVIDDDDYMFGLYTRPKSAIC